MCEASMRTNRLAEAPMWALSYHLIGAAEYVVAI
jgi:hypothetical protein